MAIVLVVTPSCENSNFIIVFWYYCSPARTIGT